jgi:ABC-type Mn2+/Zn2+ transport system permease subunit
VVHGLYRPAQPLSGELDDVACARSVAGLGMTASFVVAVTIAVVAGASGVLLSYQWDLPTGPTIVAALSALLLLCGLLKQLMRLRPATAH